MNTSQYPQPQQFNPTSYVKDAIIILSFLAGVAGIYVKLTEQVVKLEQKVTFLEASVKDLKESNQKVVDKMDTLRNMVPAPNSFQTHR